jgi:two-component system chemotaxis sensor kinase CheA
MVDFSVFDSILDSIFVVDGMCKIVYCNDAAATFCQSSIRRMVNKTTLDDLLKIKESGILPFTEESPGRSAPTAVIETEFFLSRGNRSGKIQLTIRPIDAELWGFFIRDVSLEEALYSKFRSELAQKEDYARNLEKLVEARTAELSSVNQTLNAILNSLGQGFFTFNELGQCGDVYTKACETILESIPRGRLAWDVLKIPAGEREQFRKWMLSSFKESLPFEEMKSLGPAVFPRGEGWHVVLDYFPIRRKGEGISEIVVVATDKSAEFKIQQELEVERQFAAMIVRYTKNRDRFLQFLASVRLSIKKLLVMAETLVGGENMAESLRVLHTIEGEAGAFSLRELRGDSRNCQQLIERYKDGTDIPQEAFTPYRQALMLMNSHFEEFLKVNADLFPMSQGGVDRMVEIPLDVLSSFHADLAAAGVDGRLRRKFQELFFKVPIGTRMKYFDGLVQAVAERLGKKISPLVIEGGEIRIFPEAYHKIFASMVHAFRNAVDHGLETPEEREWAGKPAAGQILVKIHKHDGLLHITIRDDGRGIDPTVIRAKLRERFPGRSFDSETDEEIIQEVCSPGFSSRDSIGEFSGRGVGLDALREEVLNAGGSLHLKSEVGRGTSIEITIPELGPESAALMRSA